MIVRVDQHLGARPEGVGADREGRVVGQLELAQLRAQARQQHAEPEGLGDVVVGAAVETEDGVGVGIVRGQHDDRGLDALAAHQPAEVAAVGVRQADIQQDDLEMVILDDLERALAVLGLEGDEAFVQLELLGERAAQRLVVVDDQDLLAVGHRGPRLSPRLWLWRHQSNSVAAAVKLAAPARPIWLADGPHERRARLGHAHDDREMVHRPAGRPAGRASPRPPSLAA